MNVLANSHTYACTCRQDDLLNQTLLLSPHAHSLSPPPPQTRKYVYPHIHSKLIKTFDCYLCFLFLPIFSRLVSRLHFTFKVILQGKVTISIYKFSVNNIVLYYIQLSHNKNLDFSICFFNRKCKNINQLITIKNDRYRWQDDNSTFLCNWECFYNTKLLWGIETYDAAAFAQKFLNLTNELRYLKLILGCPSYFLIKEFCETKVFG